MIMFNGLKFISSKIDCLDETVHGFYKVRRSHGKTAIQLMDRQGTLKAVIAPSGVVTTASMLDGKPWYSFGLASDTESWLKLSGVRLSVQTDLARLVLSSIE